ncbi:restriction endonuclease subunit S [Micromonospora sp. RHAY321]|nr:restriction endonuclease subunit S [Micromonospora sp. RHAY321]
MRTGHTPSRRVPEYWDGDIPWLGIPDANRNNGGVVEDTARQITDAGLENSSAELLPANTVCLSRTASIGYAVRLGRPMATSQDFVNWICSVHVDARWLQLLLLAERDSLRSFGKGSTHKTIYFRDFDEFHVLLPPIEEQREVARLLELGISKLEAIQDLLVMATRTAEELGAAFVRSALRGKFTQAVPEGEERSSLLGQLEIPMEGAPRRAKGSSAEGSASTPSPTAGPLLLTILTESGVGLTPEQAFRAAGYKSDEVDEFYRVLQSLVSDGKAVYAREADLIRAVR